MKSYTSRLLEVVDFSVKGTAQNNHDEKTTMGHDLRKYLENSACVSGNETESFPS